MNKKLLKIIILVTFLVTLIFAVSLISNSTLSLQGQTGTCCPESNSKCVIGNIVYEDHYYKESGPCNELQL